LAQDRQGARQGRQAVIYSSTFIFAARQFDDEFHRLDQLIATAAKKLPGYLGEEAWENAATGLVSNVYYWSSLDALQALMSHPAHLQAKASHEQWLAGYRVVIAQVMRAYGGGEIVTGIVEFDASWLPRSGRRIAASAAAITRTSTRVTVSAASASGVRGP